jgi:hypothetical protein
VTDPSHTDQAEPTTSLIRTFAVRRADDNLNSFVDTIVKLIDGAPTVVDLSRHDRRADTIELRVVDRTPRSAR